MNSKENPELLSEGNDAQARHSRVATSLTTAFEPLNRSLKTSLTRLSRTKKRSERSRRVFKKPIYYKNDRSYKYKKDDRYLDRSHETAF